MPRRKLPSEVRSDSQRLDEIVEMLGKIANETLPDISHAQADTLLILPQIYEVLSDIRVSVAGNAENVPRMAPPPDLNLTVQGLVRLHLASALKALAAALEAGPKEPQP